MKFTKIKQLLISAVLVMTTIIGQVVSAESDLTSVEYEISRVVNSAKTSGSAFGNNTEITDGVYVLLKFTPQELNLEGIYSAELKFDISDKSDSLEVYADRIPSDWNAKTATKYSTTYGDTVWASGVTEKVATAISQNGQVSLNIKEDLKEQLSNSESVYYSVYAGENTSFKITTSSVRIEIGANPAHNDFNTATEENIEEVILKYMSGEKLDEYKALEDKSFINAKMLKKKDYASMEDVEEAFDCAFTAYYIDLINKADEENIEELLLKYLSQDALEEYKKISDKTEINAKVAAKDDFATIKEIEDSLKIAVDEYYESHAYLFEEGYYIEIPVYDYAKADINQKTAGTDYATIGSYNNSSRAMLKFDLRDVDLDKAGSIKISYNTLEKFGNWYVYDKNGSYATNFVKMHSNWQGVGITYDNTFFEDKTVVGTAYKTDKGTYATMLADVTDDVKERGKDAEFISYYLMGVEPWLTGFNSSCCYVFDKNSNIKMFVEYQNDAESFYTSNISDGEEAVVVDSDIILNFEKELNSETVTKDNIIVTENGNNFDKFNILSSGKTVTIKFTDDLKFGAEYKLKIKSNMTFAGDKLHYYFKPLTFKTDVEVFENDGLTVLNSEGETITSLEGITGEVTAKTRLKNNKFDEIQKMIVSIVLIEETECGDIMRAVKVVPVNLSKGMEKEVEKTFSLGDGKYRIECMVWDSFASRITKSATLVE